MQPSSELGREQVRQVWRYLNGETRLEDLEEWSVSRFQALLTVPDPQAQSLFNGIEADLIELGLGLLTEQEMRQHLEGLAREAETVECAFAL